LFVDYTPESWNNRTISLKDSNQTRLVFYSYDLLGELQDNNIEISTDFNLPINCVNNNQVNISEIVKTRSDLVEAIYICKGGYWLHGQWFNQNSSGQNVFYTKSEVEKMSKSKLNALNPDDLVAKYGADTFRMYEMFLGPVEMSKPWDTKGIEGVHRFLKKFWRLFYDDVTPLSARRGAGGEAQLWTDEEPTAEELKVLHHAIKKIESDTERFSFNTAVSAFMIATNELTDLKCHKRKILESLLILLAPYAPHIAEELYHLLGSSKVPSLPGEGVGGEASILDASYPQFEEKYVKESSKAYPIAINGKTRTELTIALDATQQQVEAIVLADETVKKWLEGKTPKKIIYVKNKMVNLVV
jgi:leucyl-tRNA synthetase